MKMRIVFETEGKGVGDFKIRVLRGKKVVWEKSGELFEPRYYAFSVDTKIEKQKKGKIRIKTGDERVVCPGRFGVTVNYEPRYVEIKSVTDWNNFVRKEEFKIPEEYQKLKFNFY